MQRNGDENISGVVVGGGGIGANGSLQLSTLKFRAPLEAAWSTSELREPVGHSKPT